MLLRFVYRTADISALSRRLDSAEIYISHRYINVNGILYYILIESRQTLITTFVVLF